MTPLKFRKKPVVIEAMQWDGTAESATSIIDWILANGGTARYVCSDPERCAKFDGDCPHHIAIDTLEGTMAAGLNWWVIRGVKGEFYPCDAGIFAATYDAELPGLHPVTLYQAECTSCGRICEDYGDFTCVDDSTAVTDACDFQGWFERSRLEASPTPDHPNRSIHHTVELLCPDCQKCEICGANGYSVDSEHLVCEQHEGHDFGGEP